MISPFGLAAPMAGVDSELKDVDGVDSSKAFIRRARQIMTNHHLEASIPLKGMLLSEFLQHIEIKGGLSKPVSLPRPRSVSGENNGIVERSGINL